MPQVSDQPDARELRVFLGAGLVHKGVVLVGAGMVCIAAALVLAFVFTTLLPPDVRFWATLGLSAMAIGCFLLGSAALVLAKARSV